MPAALTALLLACSGAAPVDDSGPGGDTLDCSGEDLGADSDGDGWTDCEELDCASDPSDDASACYACGWSSGDPGDLTSDGAAEGDVIRNVTLYDACEEQIPIWDFAGAYRLLVVTTGWCEPCWEEVQEIPARQSAFEEAWGRPLRYLVVLYQDAAAQTADGGDVADYIDHLALDSDEVDVLAEPTQTILDAIPWEGALPGKCALTPGMEMLHCYSGDDDEEAWGKIAEHAGL